MNIKQLNKQVKQAQQASNNAIKLALQEAKNTIGEENYPKWQDLMSRLIDARLNGDAEKVKSLTKDLEILTGG